jgi:hypothetical protein
VNQDCGAATDRSTHSRQAKWRDIMPATSGLRSSTADVPTRSRLKQLNIRAGASAPAREALRLQASTR